MAEEPINPEMIMKQNIGLYPWWVVLIWGILALLIGIMFLTTAAVTTVVFITLLGAFWFVGGIFSLASLAVDRSQMGWKIVLAILNMIVGIIILSYPLYSTLLLLEFFVIFIGIWACITGGAHLYQAFATKDAGNGLLGVFSLIFGILLLAFPIVSIAILPFIAGAFCLIVGIATVIVAFTAKKAYAALNL
jgi:uncharacterized membrane protein HdeD (DUF308 family)